MNRNFSLPNTDRVQPDEDYVRGCTWQLIKVNTIYRFNISVYDRGDSSLECFNRVIHSYGCGSRFQSDFVRGKTITVFVKSYMGVGVMNIEECMLHDCLKGSLSLLFVALVTLHKLFYSLWHIELSFGNEPDILA